MIKKNYIQKKALLEKRVLDIIKSAAHCVNRYGVLYLSFSSGDNRDEFDLFEEVIRAGMLEYFEKEYSLYLVSNYWVNGSWGGHSELEFVWNAAEYYKNNADYKNGIGKKSLHY